MSDIIYLDVEMKSKSKIQISSDPWFLWFDIKFQKEHNKKMVTSEN